MAFRRLLYIWERDTMEHRAESERGLKNEQARRRWAALAERARDGDRDAFDELLKSLLPILYACAYRVVGHAQEAEDVVQEAVLRAWMCIRELKNTKFVLGWLETIVVRVGVKYNSKRRKELLVMQEYASLHVQHNVDAGDPVIFEQQIELYSALRKLPEREQQILWLYAEGYSLDEIATLSGCSKRMVRRRLHKGLTKLRKMMR